jgi:hypothetical protein
MKSNAMIIGGASVLVAILLSAALRAQNVGIGVTNPQSKLSVNGTTSSGGLAIGDSAFTSTAGTVAPVNGAMIQGSTGMGGITTPNAALHVYPQIYVAGAGVTGRFYNGTANQDGTEVTLGLVGIQRSQFYCLNLAKPTGGDQYLQAFVINGVQQGQIVLAGGGVAYQTTSDERLKENIRPSAKGLNEVMKIQVRDYNFKSKPGQNETGFIAQQLYTVLPDVVTRGGDDPAVHPWAVDYGRVTPLLTRAIQEQQVEIDALKAENARLRAENLRSKGQTDKLAAKMEALEKTIAAMQTKHNSVVRAVVLNK